MSAAQSGQSYLATYPKRGKQTVLAADLLSLKHFPLIFLLSIDVIPSSFQR